VLHRPGSGLWLWLDVGDLSRPGRPLQAMIVSYDSAGDCLHTRDVRRSQPASARSVINFR
jgi:hypothetical protein